MCVVNKLRHKITLFELLPEQKSKFYRRKTTHIPKIYGSLNQSPAQNQNIVETKLLNINYILLFDFK